MLYGSGTLFTSAWLRKLFEGMQAITVGVPGGGVELTDRVVDNLHKRYMYHIGRGDALPRYDTSAGNEPARLMLLKIKAETGLSAPIVRAFLVTLYKLQKSGEIAEVKFDPAGARVRAAAAKKLDPGADVGGFFKKMIDAYGKVGIGMILLAGLGAAVYFKIGRK